MLGLGCNVSDAALAFERGGYRTSYTAGMSALDHTMYDGAWGAERASPCGSRSAWPRVERYLFG